MQITHLQKANDVLKNAKQKIDRKIQSETDFVFDQERMKEYENEIELLLSEENKLKIQATQNDS